MFSRLFSLLIKLFFTCIILGIIAVALIWFSPQIPFLKDRLPAALRENIIKILTNLVPEGHDYSHPAWDAAGKKIALVIAAKDKRKSVTYDLYLYHTSDRKLVRLTRNNFSNAVTAPAFSPKGHTIVFTVVRGLPASQSSMPLDHPGNANLFGEIYLVDEAGFKLEKLSEAEVPSFTTPSSNIWSQDGQKLLYYAAQNNNQWRIIMLDVGTRERKVIQTNGDALAPSWSPNGDAITWQGKESGTEYRIFTGKNNGSEAKAITQSGDYRYPIWSPDGNKILFVVYRDGKPASLGVVSPTGEQFQVFTGIPPEPKNPSWSYNGRHIIFEAKDHSGASQIYAVDDDGDNIRALTAQIEHKYPVWRPQDRTLLCVSPESRIRFPSWLSSSTFGTAGLFILDKDGTLHGHKEDEGRRVPIPINPQ